MKSIVRQGSYINLYTIGRLLNKIIRILRLTRLKTDGSLNYHSVYIITCLNLANPLICLILLKSFFDGGEQQFHQNGFDDISIFKRINI